MRSLILSQWRDLRIGVTREDLGAYAMHVIECYAYAMLCIC